MSQGNDEDGIVMRARGWANVVQQRPAATFPVDDDFDWDAFDREMTAVPTSPAAPNPPADDRGGGFFGIDRSGERTLDDLRYTFSEQQDDAKTTVLTCKRCGLEVKGSRLLVEDTARAHICFAPGLRAQLPEIDADAPLHEQYEALGMLLIKLAGEAEKAAKVLR